MTIDTRVTPVQYGRAYLDDAQWAEQQAALSAVESGRTLYGPNYGVDESAPIAVEGMGGGVVGGIAAPVANETTTPTDPPADTLPIAALREQLANAAEADVLAALDAELHRAAGPRKSALEELRRAAVRLGLTALAEQLVASLAELDAA